MSIIKKIVSIITVISLVALLYPLAPPQPQTARAATPGKFTDVSVTASNYTYDAAANITFTFTTANSLTAENDVIRFYFENFSDWANTFTLSSITDDGGSIDYMEYKSTNYIEVYLVSSPVAAGSVVEAVFAVTHRDIVGYERVGIVSFSPDGGGTAYEGCTDAGGGGAWDDCTPYYVIVPVGTPEVKGRVLGPIGTADVNNGIFETNVNLWNSGGYWNWAATDHLGYFYFYQVPTSSCELDFSKPWDAGVAYSAPDNQTTTVTSGSTTDMGIIRYNLASATGIVKREDNGQALQDVNINFMNIPMPPTNTDENGRFYLPRVDPGTYYVMIEKPWGEAGEGLVNPEPISVTVTAGSTTNMGTIYLESANKTIKGTVRHPNGNPVTDAQIGCNTPMGGGWYSATTNGAGYYELLVGKGHWMCWVEHDYSIPDHQFNWVYFDMPSGITFSADNAVTETKTQNYTVTAIDSTIRGRVLKPNGSPLTGEPVNVEIFNQTGGGNWIQVDSATGAFSVGVPAGTYQVMVNMWSDNWGGPSPQTVTVSANSTYNMGNLYLLPKSASISGTVSDTDRAGLNNQFVDCWVQNEWGKWSSGNTNSNGDFSFAAFGGSTYMCNPMTNMGGWGGENEETYVYLGAPQSVNLPNVTSAATGVDFELTRADATINVTAVDSNGDQINDIWGYAFIGMGDMMGPGMGGTPIDGGTGSFKIPSAQCPASSPCYLSISMPPGQGADYSPAGAVSFSVTANGTANVKVAMVPNDATLTGYIVDSNGDAITGVSAVVFADKFATMSFFESWVNIATGQYTMNTAPGTYTLGYFVDKSTGYLASGMTDNEVTTVSGQSVTKNLTLAEIDSWITVSVKAPNGGPMPGAFVDASTQSGLGEIHDGPMMGPGMMMGPMMGPGMMGEMTGADGTATIGLPGGSTYYVSASLPPEMSYINPAKQAVTIESGETATLTLQFRESDATIYGTVTKDGTATYAGVYAYSDTGGFTQDFAWNGAYSLNVTQGDNWHVITKAQVGNDYYSSGEKVVTVDEAMETLNLELSLAVANIPDPVTATFTCSNPAVVAFADNSVTVNLPAGALSASQEETCKITLTPQPLLPDTAERKVFRFGTEIVGYVENAEKEDQFNSSATVTICWNAEAMEALGLTIDNFNGSYWDESAASWMGTNNSTSDEDNNCITFQANHFTDFAITSAEISAPRITVTSPEDETTTITANSIVVEGTVSDVNADLTIALDGTSIGAVSIDSATGAFSETVTDLSIGTNTITVDAENGVGTAATVSRTVTYDAAGEGDLGTVTGVELSLAAMPYGDGGPQIRLFDKEGTAIGTFFAYSQDLVGQFQMVSADLDGDGAKEIITSTGEGFGPQIRVFKADGTLLDTFFAYQESFRGGVDLALGDISGDGNIDLVTKPTQGGGPNVRVYQWDTATHSFELLDWFMAFNEGFRGEINWLLTDVDNDDAAEIIMAPKSQGGPNVRVYQYNGNAMEVKDWFMAYDENFLGGVNILAGDVDGDNIKEIITTPHQQGAPNVRIYQWNTASEQYEVLDWFWAFQNSFRGQFNTKIADVNGDGNKDIIVAPAEAGGPNVRVYTYNTTDEIVELIDWFWAYQQNYLGGVNLDIADLDGDGNKEIITTPNASGGPNIRAYEYNPDDGAFETLDWIMAYHDTHRGMIETQVTDLDGNGDSELIVAPLTNGGPNVRIYNYADGDLQLDNWFWAFAETFEGGVNIQTLY
ncbi:MAG: FG-GAP-like repeat-containing protein [Patescibacteria group bacterium]